MNEALRVAIVGPLPPPNGGMANQTRQLAELLVGEGVAVSIIQVNAPYRPAWVGKFPVLRAAFRLLPYCLRLWRVIGRSDVVHVMANSGWSWHVFATPAILIARARGVPAIVNYRGGEAQAFLEKSAPMVRSVIRQASLLAVPSPFLREVFERFGMAATIVPNIVNLERFSGNSVRRGTRRHLLVARNLEPIYGNETAIRALALVRSSHPDVTLTIAGSGPLRGQLSDLAASLGLSSAVTFAGRLEPQQMADLYRSTDIALNPSLVDNMPNSVLEAMATGLPIISTNVGGVPHILRNDETAILVSPNAPEEMAQAIVRLIEDEALCARMTRSASVDVRRYSWQRVWPAWSEAYRVVRTSGRHLAKEG